MLRIQLIFTVLLLSATGCRPKCDPCPKFSFSSKKCVDNTNSTVKNNKLKTSNVSHTWLSLDDAATGKPMGRYMAGSRFSPNGKIVSFLKVVDGKSDLYEINVSSGRIRALIKSSEIVRSIRESTEEKADRERKRISFTGITSYSWSPDSKGILFPLSGDLYLYTIGTGRLKKLTSDKTPELNPEFSPDGKRIAWVKKGNVEVLDLKSSKITKITSGGSDNVFFGRSEFVAQEEMGRYKGFFWSPDSKNLIILKVDETGVEKRARLDLNSDGFKVVNQRYPRATTANARVTAYVTSVEKPALKVLNAGKYEYIARAGWIDNGNLFLAIQTRDQKKLEVKECNTKGKCSLLFEENDKKWVELNNNLKFIKNSKQFFYSSDNPDFRPGNFKNSGVNTLMLLERTSAGIILKNVFRPLQNGVFSSIARIDQNKTRVFVNVYTSRGLNKQLMVWDYKSNTVKVVTALAGWNDAVVSPDCNTILNRFSSLLAVPVTQILTADGSVLKSIPAQGANVSLLKGLTVPETVNIPGPSPLNGLLFKPPGYTGNVAYPVIVYVYGGPHGHMVRNMRSRYNLWNQYMAQMGFIVLMVDGRGGMYSNRTFSRAPYRKVGVYEVEDSAAIVNYLRKRRDVDSSRIGIWGWSYGGYAVLASMTIRNDLFAAGLSVAPPTDWTLYDTHYTERYIGVNPSWYSSSKIDSLKIRNLKSPLMVIHGMSDDNVLLINSLKVISELQNQNKLFRMMLYPGKAHSLWGKNTRKHLISTITGFFIKQLGPAKNKK
ncbi:MAG: DPP IV N-terminal domain-containing protein [Deltaproteobacteria bacterium]|nr:DPP IV N-terminal domain-containing protein [Deltaproteobacteria bacterium]